MAQLNFNAANVAPRSAFDTLPAGWYNVMITGSETKPTKDGGGSYLSLTLTIINGPMANRKLFDRLNTVNKSKQAQDIAFQTLSAICHATGVIQVQDSQHLHGIPIQAKVKIRAASGGYDEANEIAGYKAIEGGAPVGSGAPTPAPAWLVPSAPAQPAAPAWQPPAAPAAAPDNPAAPPWAKQ